MVSTVDVNETLWFGVTFEFYKKLLFKTKATKHIMQNVDGTNVVNETKILHGNDLESAPYPAQQTLTYNEHNEPEEVRN
jgi:hypothetical protein